MGEDLPGSGHEVSDQGSQDRGEGAEVDRVLPGELVPACGRPLPAIGGLRMMSFQNNLICAIKSFDIDIQSLLLARLNVHLPLVY